MNTQHVVEIRLRTDIPGEGNATLMMRDGSIVDGFVHESEVEALTEKVLPAPAGFEAHREFNFDFDDDEVPEELEWKPVVGFAFNPGGEMLDPITAEDGHLKKYAVRGPDGKIYTSSEEFFDNADDYRAFLSRRLAKQKGKAA